MKRRTVAGAACAALIALPLATALPAGGLTIDIGVGVEVPEPEGYKVLVVGKTLGFRHSHIDETTESIIALGEANGFTVDVWDPPNSSAGWWGSGSPGQPELTLETTPFTSAEDLSQYATIAFVSPVDNTNNAGPDAPRLLDPTETEALQGYIRGGGGFFGVHAASDTMHNVPWFGELIGGGAYFRNHPANQNATMRVESPGHPSTQHLPASWNRFDEWYNYKVNPRPVVHVLMTLDESTYNPGSGRMGADHPIAWCHNFEGGRSWYQGAGHVEGSYEDPAYLQHLLAGLEWTAGRVSGGGDCVTFHEVNGVLADAEVGDAADSIADVLAQARAAAEDDDHSGAVALLQDLQTDLAGLGEAEGLGLLQDKVDDLIEWQSGLIDAREVPLDATVASACLGSKAVVSVRVRATGDEATDVAIRTDHGTRSYQDVAPRKLVAQNFLGGSSVEAGVVKVSTWADSTGKGAAHLPYEAISCT